MQKDGTIIIDTKINADGFKDAERDIRKGFDDLAKSAGNISDIIEDAATGADKFADELDDVGSAAENADKKTDNLWGTIFGANALADVATDALAKIAEGIKEFVTDSIEAAADVRAENAQFAETFKDLEKKASKSLDSIADEAGISASRMKKSYTKTFAFTKSVGADSKKAMDIANRAMKAAADSAAYYDRSIEEATETLQSFLKGNYENDAALGIAVTETTRNAKANELYAMSFDRLSEAQKVDVLLAMVEAGNQASGAIGQAARESDSWTNVLGELEESFRQFLAVVGDPILDALTPIIQSITGAIKSLSKASASEELRDGIEKFIDAWEGAEKVFQDTSKEVEANAIMAKHYVQRLEDLESAGLKTAEAQREYAATVENLNDLIPDLNLVIDENTGLLTENKEALYSTIEAMKKRALYEAAQERYANSAKAQAEAILDVRDAEIALISLQAEEAVLLNDLNALTEKFRTGTTNAANAVRNLPAPVLEAQNALRKNHEEQQRLNAQIEKSNVMIAEYDTKLQGMTQSLDQAADSSEDLTQKQSAVQTATEETSLKVQELKESYDNAKTAARESVDAQIGLFDELSTKSDYTAAKIIENWRSQQQAFADYSKNLQSAVDMGLDQALVQQLSDGSERSMQILHALVNDTDISIDDINKAFYGVSESKETVSAVMADISTGFSDSLDQMAKDIEEQWGSMAKTVGLEVAQMQEYIDSLHGKTVKLEIKKGGTGGGVAFSETTTPSTAFSAFSASSPQIPYLASGAVIPPNAPFMAVLGDQRHGTNIEAPLETIQTALASVLDGYLAGNMAGNAAVVERLERLIAEVRGISIGDDEVGRAASRYLAKMKGVQAGK